MPRQRRKFLTKEREQAHERALAKRRAAHRDAATLRMAKKAAEQGAEGEADFEMLVEAEKQRIETKKQTDKRKGGQASPKVIVAARDSLSRAFDLMGGVAALVVWGRANPTEFYRIWARLIPREAADSSAALPLETLLEKLATREAMSVGQAAMAIGQELIDEGRRNAEIEDIASLRPEKIN